MESRIEIIVKAVNVTININNIRKVRGDLDFVRNFTDNNYFLHLYSSTNNSLWKLDVFNGLVTEQIETFTLILKAKEDIYNLKFESTGERNAFFQSITRCNTKSEILRPVKPLTLKIQRPSAKPPAPPVPSATPPVIINKAPNFKPEEKLPSAELKENQKAIRTPPQIPARINVIRNDDTVQSTLPLTKSNEKSLVNNSNDTDTSKSNTGNNFPPPIPKRSTSKPEVPQKPTNLTFQRAYSTNSQSHHHSGSLSPKVEKIIRNSSVKFKNALHAISPRPFKKQEERKIRPVSMHNIKIEHLQFDDNNTLNTTGTSLTANDVEIAKPVDTPPLPPKNLEAQNQTPEAHITISIDDLRKLKPVVKENIHVANSEDESDSDGENLYVETQAKYTAETNSANLNILQNELKQLNDELRQEKVEYSVVNKPAKIPMEDNSESDWEE